MNRPSVDEARLLPRYRPTPMRIIPVESLGVDTLTLNTKAPTSAIHKAEPGDLRGIPALAPGVGGVQPGTQPERATIAKLSRTRAA